MKIIYKRVVLLICGVSMLLSCATYVEPENRKDASTAKHKEIISGNIQHSYERSTRIKFDFIQRRKAFSDSEIKSIKEALDKLPDVYLEKVIASGVNKFYRVPSFPIKSDHFLDVRDKTAMTVFKGGFITFTDSAFNNNYADVYKTVVHQTAHCVARSEAGSSSYKVSASFTLISWTHSTPPYGIKSYNGFVNAYARTSPQEDYAESSVYFWLDPDKLEKINPAKYSYMRDKVFETISPANARQALPAAEHVYPIITSLSSSTDDVANVVIITGRYFMGPVDGGYNKVRFGTKTASSVPVSDTMMYVWVPDVSEGDYPITVTTQDGMSNAVPFTVTDVWWKFW